MQHAQRSTAPQCNLHRSLAVARAAPMHGPAVALAGNRPVQLKRSNWDDRSVVDKKTGKAKKRTITVSDKPAKKPAVGTGILHR